MTDPTCITDHPESYRELSPAALPHLQAGASPLQPEVARAWALVLEARGIPCHLEPCGWGYRLLVPIADQTRSIEELRIYQAENRNWPPPAPPSQTLAENTLTTLSVLGLLAIFHNLTYLYPAIDWIALGNAHAGKILSGQWWRLVTALTLHADGQHLLGNLLIGGVLIVRLCRQFGSGLGWLLLLLSGLLGNFCNALIQPSYHQAVGASTAVFGALGVFAGLNLVRARANWWKPGLLSLAAALALLGLLGSGGERTDLGAHLFGFLVGLPLGAAAALGLKAHSRPPATTNAFLAVAATLLPLLAWISALGAK